MNVNFAQVRERLERRRGDLLQRSRRVERDVNHADEPLAADFSDQAVAVQNDEALAAIGRAAQAEVAEIAEALQRLATGEYGMCKVCGRPIDTRRLAALPHSVRCATCWG